MDAPVPEDNDDDYNPTLPISEETDPKDDSEPVDPDDQSEEGPDTDEDETGISFVTFPLCTYFIKPIIIYSHGR